MGMPTVVITALPAVAVKVGANRVVRGKGFSHPCGNPALDPPAERAFRLTVVRTALNALNARQYGDRIAALELRWGVRLRGAP